MRPAHRVLFLLFLLCGLSCFELKGQQSFQRILWNTGADFLQLYHHNSDISVTPDSGYYFATIHHTTEKDAWIVKYDLDNQIDWQTSLDSFDLNYIQVQTTPDSGVVVGGNRLVKLDSGGNVSWSKKLTNSSNFRVLEIEITADSGFYILMGGGLSNPWLVRTDQFGNKLWSRTFTSFFPNQMDVLPGDRLALYGGQVVILSASGAVDHSFQYSGITISDGDPMPNGDFVFVYTEFNSQCAGLMRADSSGQFLWRGSICGWPKPGGPHSHSKDYFASKVIALPDSGIAFTLTGSEHAGVHFGYYQELFVVSDTGAIIGRRVDKGISNYGNFVYNIEMVRFADKGWGYLGGTAFDFHRVIEKLFDWGLGCTGVCSPEPWDNFYLNEQKYPFSTSVTTLSNSSLSIDSFQQPLDTISTIQFLECKVDTLPTAIFNPSVTINPALVTLGNASINASCYFWDFGDGTIGQGDVGHHIYQNPGTYTICLTALNSLGNDTSCQTVTITLDSVIAGFHVASGQMACQGNAVHFIDTSAGFPNQRTWLFPGSNSPVVNNVSQAWVNYPSTGPYDVTLIVSNGISSDTLHYPNFITVNPSPNISLDINHICAGGPLGSAVATVTGGTAPYQYYWTPNLGPPTIGLDSVGGLGMNTLYTVEVTDSFGCMNYDTFSVSFSWGASVSAQQLGTNPVICPGNSVNLTMNYSSPIGINSIFWEVNGQVIPGTNSTNFQLPFIQGTNNYTVKANIIDEDNCVFSSSPIIYNLNPQVNFNVTTQDPCPGPQPLGTAQLSGLPSTYGPYQISWSNGQSGNLQTAGTNNNLSPGNHWVIASDNNQCKDTVNFSIGFDTIPQPTIVANNGTELCLGQPIALSVSSGTYTSYQWYRDNDPVQGGSGAQLNATLPGVYYVEVTEGQGCTGASNTITVISSPLPDISLTGNNVTCPQGNDGSIVAQVSSGVQPYTYNWSTNATTSGLSNLTAGTYILTVTDSIGCVNMDTMSLTVPPNFIQGFVNTEPDCFGAASGSIDFTISGGTSPYSFLWSTGDTTEDIQGLLSGIYAVTVTDSSGCIDTLSTFIGQPAAIQLSTQITDVTCHGAFDGEIDLSVSGGTGTYTYWWNNGYIFQDRWNLLAGTHSVTVTDVNGCTGTGAFQVQEPSPVTSTIAGTSNMCGFSNGSVDLSPSGGISPYNYNWSTGSTNQDINSLTGGTYSVTITDANGCSTSNSVSIINQSLGSAVISNSGSNVLCQGQSTLLSESVSGWSTYQWLKNGVPINGATSVSYLVSDSGSYRLLITDNSGCIDTSSAIEISLVPLPIVTISGLAPEYCENDLPVQLSGNPQGGIWAGQGMSGNQFDPSVPGVGFVDIFYTYTDSNNCTDSTQLTTSILDAPGGGQISGPANVQFNAVHTYQFPAGSFSSINWSVSGGTQNSQTGNQVEIQWGNSSTGQLSVIETNSGGCSVTDTLNILISVVGLQELFVGPEVNIFPNPNNGAFTVRLPENHQYQNLELFDARGRMVFQRGIKTVETEQQVNLNRLAAGVYVLRLAGKRQHQQRIVVR